MNEQQHDLFGDALDPSLLEQAVAQAEQHRWPELLRDINSLLRNELVKRGVDNNLSLPLTYAIAKNLGGMQIYIPKGDALETMMRDMQIWSEFNGNNVAQLTIKYNVTFKTVYSVIARMRELERKRRQPDMFD